jgi:hypothetical protein
MEARHNDLDLTSDEDRAIYRTRVAEEFKMMKFGELAREANRLMGREKAGTKGISTINDAVRVIASCRIMQATGVWYG